MAQRPNQAEIPEEPQWRTTPRLLPPWIGPSRMDKLFDEHEFEQDRQPMPAVHMLADAGDDSPALLEIAQFLASGSPQAPTRIDLSGMPGARTRGETTRFDMPAMIEAMQPQTVNREAKRDSLASVETPSMARGITQEALGQALLMGYGDDLEGWLTGRHADDIRRERNAFTDAHPATALASYVGGIAGGGLAGRAIKGGLAAGRLVDDLEEAAPRFEPDLRQAMRNAERVETQSRSTDELADQLQRLLSNPEARRDIQGQPRELSPADIFTMTAGAETNPPAPEISEHDMSGLGPIERLQMGLELGQAAGQNLTEDEKARNAATNREAALGMLPVIGNWMAARDAGNAAGAASAAFSRGDTKTALMQSALAALSGVGAITGMPGSRMAGPSAADASRTANIFAGPGAKTADHAMLRRAEEMKAAGADRADIWRETGWFTGADGKWRFEIDDSAARANLSKLGAHPSPMMPGSKAGTLAEGFEHPALYDAYPNMLKTELYHSPSERRVGRAVYQHGDEPSGIPDSITVTGSSRDNTSSVLHEGQHGVQRRESTAPGGSTMSAFPMDGKGGAWPLYRERVQAVTTPHPLERYAREAGFDSIEDARPSYEKYVKDTRAMGRKGLPPHLERVVQNSVAEDWYMRLAGEVEARNVQARQGMTAAERRATPPWETQDTPDDMQILREPREAYGPEDVFVPMRDEDKIADILNRRHDNRSANEIHRLTGGIIEPGGRVLEEIADNRMTTGMGNFKPGDVGKLGEYVDHPIFDQRPHYRDIETAFTDKVDSRGGSPIAMTRPEGFELSLAPGDQRKNVAKLLQYQIIKDDKLPQALRHTSNIPELASERIADASKLPIEGAKDIDALAAYVAKLQGVRDDMLEATKSPKPHYAKNMATRQTERQAGNIMARIVAGRAGAEGDVSQIYPYLTRTPYINRSRPLPSFDEIWTLPPEGATPEEFLQFLRDWRQYGSGRGR
jgi:hypothetical protein